MRKLKSNKLLVGVVIVGFLIISILVYSLSSGLIGDLFGDDPAMQLLKEYENKGYTVLLYKVTENRTFGNGTLSVYVERNKDGKGHGKTYLSVKLPDFNKKNFDIKWSDDGAMLEIKDNDSVTYAKYPILWENIFDNEENQSRNNLSERSESYG